MSLVPDRKPIEIVSLNEATLIKLTDLSLQEASLTVTIPYYPRSAYTLGSEMS
jgi:hypothetical protein